jgi:quercetin dioxygenase-like cupin family protein
LGDFRGRVARMSVVTFPSPTEVGPRDWGTEMMLHHAQGLYTFKMITMEKGKKGGLQQHRIKDECGLMVRGHMELKYDDGKGELISRIVEAGDVFHIPPGATHQGIALTDCCYLEVSNPIFNDRVHVEDKYGIKKEEGGLPSTKPWEIERR